MASLLICAGLALLLLAQHPFVTYPASLAALARFRPRPLRGGQGPVSAALCVCAYNEERVIRDKALNMLALQAAFPPLELLVFLDGGTDRTGEILREFAGRIRVVQGRGRNGKTAGMNQLVALTAAECVVFSDANVTMDPAALGRLLAAFGDPAVGVACGQLRYRPAPGSPTAAMGSLYWRLEEVIKRLESRTGSVMGADGSIFAMRRGLCAPVPSHLIDDMYASLAALCTGARVVSVPDALAFEDQVSDPGEEFHRKVRIACQAFNVHRALRPGLHRLPALDRYKYGSHKLLRWFVGPLLGLGCAALATGLGLAGAWRLLAAGGVVAAAAVAVPQTRSVLLAFVGTALGVFHSVRGEQFRTWTPPASTRSAIQDAG